MNLQSPESDSAPTPQPQPEIPALPPPDLTVGTEKKDRTGLIAGIIALVIIALTVLSVIGLLQPGTPTNKIRDIFIIFMAVQSLVIGFTLIVLIFQLSRLINLLQNEIKPILDSTNDSMNTLRGTIAFISDNMAEPIIKINEALAAIKQLGDFFKFTRGKK